MSKSSLGLTTTRVGLMIGSVAVACVVRALLAHFLPEGMPYVLFLAAVAVTARGAGWVWGAGAAALGLLAGSVFFADPRLDLGVERPQDIVAAIAYFVSAAVIIYALDVEQRARVRLARRDEELLKERDQRLRVQAELEDARRLEAVGTLAAGVAHDFNNLLTVVLGSATLLREVAPNEPLVENIELAGSRAAALVKQLLGFARRQVLVVQTISLNDVVDACAPLLRSLVPRDIELEIERESSPWLVLGDQLQLQQVLMNLVTNARDAMPQGGKIRVTTRAMTLDSRFAASRPEVTPGEYAHLRVADTGTGMSEEVQKRLFEPFFTTKQAGRGTGLGLAVTYGIVKQLNGHIFVSSDAADGGTVFDVYLPRTSQPAIAVDAVESKTQEPNRSLVILLVDDDEQVRSITRRTLERLGHTVIAAEGPADALQLIQAEDARVDVLLTDVVMPWLNGRQLAERVRSDRPGIGVVYMTGYSQNIVLSRGVVKAGLDVLIKPFTTAELEAALQRATRPRSVAV